MNKEIYFCVDALSLRINWDKGYCPQTYDDTENHIKEGLSPIITNSLAHLSFYLLNLGYDIYLCYKDKKVKVEEGMQLSESGYCLSEPSCCEDSDILDIFKSGYFDKMLGYDTGR